MDQQEHIDEPSLRPLSEAEVLERAVARMGWDEIWAFQAELRKGQDVREDAGGFMMRAIRRLFGLPEIDRTIETHQAAARRLVETYASNRKDGSS